MTVIPADFRPRTVIVTKRKTYVMPPDAIGVPIKDYWPDRTVPKGMEGHKVWQTEDGPVIARPDEPAH